MVLIVSDKGILDWRKVRRNGSHQKALSSTNFTYQEFDRLGKSKWDDLGRKSYFNLMQLDRKMRTSSIKRST